MFSRKLPVVLNCGCFAGSYNYGRKSESVILSPGFYVSGHDVPKAGVYFAGSGPSIGSLDDAAFVHWTGNSGRDRPDAFRFARRPCRARAGSIPKIITSPCASSAISTVSRPTKSPRCCSGSTAKPFEVALQGLSSFGGRKPRAVVASIAPSRPLIELQAELERLMQRFGLDPGGRKFTPHVTLARLHDASSQDVADYLSVRGYFPSQGVHGRALRAVLVPRLHRRRALCGRGFLRAERVRGRCSPHSRRHHRKAG